MDAMMHNNAYDCDLSKRFLKKSSSRMIIFRVNDYASRIDWIVTILLLKSSSMMESRSC
jgi:hypothetical protein